jgi:hypothetical protein
MKKFFMMAAMLISVAAMAQEAVITFNETTHDFGKINEADGRVTTVFEFKNEGMAPLVLTQVRASCGCTTPRFTSEPVEPGQTGQITVTYNPNGRPGRFQKTVTVTSNATEPTTRLYIKGEVIPKPAQPVDKYPVKMGVLGLQKKNINLGNVKRGAPKNIEIEYANNTQEEVKVGLLYNTDEAYWIPNVTLPTVAPGQTGKIRLALQTATCPIYGPLETKFYVQVNGKRVLTDEYAITIKANLVEDFSQMSAEDIQQAPIAELTNTHDAGVVKAGKKLTTKLVLGNAGVNPLMVRRVYCNDSMVSIQQPKTAIKSGKKAEIRLDINTAQSAPATYTREVMVITNDPKKPVVRVKVSWIVE